MGESIELILHGFLRYNWKSGVGCYDKLYILEMFLLKTNPDPHSIEKLK